MFIKITSGQPVGDPIFEHQFYSLYSNVSFTRPIASEDVVSRGYAFYQESSSPELGRYEAAEPSAPVQVSDDLWEQGWSVRQMTDEEILDVDLKRADLIRSLRNQLLNESDWTQFNDSPLSEADKELWAAYRISLRDVPEQSGFPWDIVWPGLPV
tara:strand:- start:52 stop:516 length:465 start_codon:yes stop_codon:yes gene_type:complete